MARTMPRQRPRRSIQEVATPPDFVQAAELLVGGRIVWDLAATERNKKAPRWLGPGGEHPDALTVRWHRLAREPGDWLWLNPPFGDIGVWAAKCAAESWLGAPILLLAPAAVSTDRHGEGMKRRSRSLSEWYGDDDNWLGTTLLVIAALLAGVLWVGALLQ